MTHSTRFSTLLLVALFTLTLLSNLTLALPLPAPEEGTTNAEVEGRDYAEIDLVSRKTAEHTSHRADYGVCYVLAKDVWQDTSYLKVKTANTVCTIYFNDSCSGDPMPGAGKKHVDVRLGEPKPVAFRCFEDKE